MRNLGVGANGSGSNGLVEVNSLMKDVRNGVSGEGKRLSEENESRINEDASDVNDRCVFHAQPIQQRQQQQLPGPVVRWERFLPVRSLCVLLVENDDSTRHIVSALLRNCSYEVTAVAHGLEAWKALEDPSIHIDLVLTEVVMPYLSGLGLLSKILSHKTYKSIPLIMMSSNDSMGIVFKCLSKGAVDFLVKPIRKNELKHIWQHVWRKCHTSSFSGSESGIRIQKPSSGSRNIDKAGIKNGSSGEDDNWSTDLNVNDGSDDGSDFGSDTQSSWSKRVVEFDSTRPITRQDESGDSPDSTCALVTHSRSEPATNNWAPRTATRERDEEGDKLVAMGKYLGIGVPINQELQVEEPNRKMQKIGAGKDNFFDSESKKDSEKFEKRIAKFNNEAVNGKLRKEYSDSMVVITNSTDPRMESATNEDDLYKNDIEDKTTDKTKKPPSLELELNSLQEGDTRTRTSDSKKNVLRHSDLSAFSRYNTTLNVNQTPTGIVGSCSPPENSSRLNIESNTDGTHNQCSNGSSNNDDMGSTTNTFPKPAYDDKKLPDTSTNTHLRSAFQPVKNSKNSSILPEIQGNTDPPTVQQKTTQQQVQVQHRHHYHHYHHHHHHVHNMQQKQQPSEHDNLSMRNTAASASHSGPSNNLTLSIDGNAAIYSLNASGSGSNNKSSGENCRDGPNDNNIVATAEGINVSSDNGGSLKCGADDGSRSGNRNDVDQNRLAQRKAALLKFRQKRKDRCFEKKVRYQSRQKLAEQRPRVKGQFVRQVVNKDKNEYPNS